MRTYKAIGPIFSNFASSVQLHCRCVELSVQIIEQTEIHPLLHVFLDFLCKSRVSLECIPESQGNVPLSLKLPARCKRSPHSQIYHRIQCQTNKRRDDYGMSAVNRLRIILDIIDAIRSSVPKSFCLAIKLNCSDLSVCHRPSSPSKNTQAAFHFSLTLMTIWLY
jgi:hypothetical protein